MGSPQRCGQLSAERSAGHSRLTYSQLDSNEHFNTYINIQFITEVIRDCDNVSMLQSDEMRLSSLWRMDELHLYPSSLRNCECLSRRMSETAKYDNN
ncbi:hypothetical protein NQZ68_000249 [Dissostichus eleginoides]|nr:hypothetical protein NQZ68_000249 [Dissostichus eleginoides]